jgi:hypothetical protein
MADPGSETYRATNPPQIVAQSTYRSVNPPEVIAGPDSGNPLPKGVEPAKEVIPSR